MIDRKSDHEYCSSRIPPGRVAHAEIGQTVPGPGWRRQRQPQPFFNHRPQRAPGLPGVSFFARASNSSWMSILVFMLPC